MTQGFFDDVSFLTKPKALLLHHERNQAGMAFTSAHNRNQGDSDDDQVQLLYDYSMISHNKLGQRSNN